MPRKRYNRYDSLEVPSGPELYAMYLNEGMSKDEAIKKAKEIHDFLDVSGRAEARLWKSVRDHEFTVGLDVEQYIEGEDRLAT